MGSLHTVVPGAARTAAGLEPVDSDLVKGNSPTEVVVVVAVVVVAVELAKQSKVSLGGEEGREMQNYGRVLTGMVAADQRRFR